MNKIKKGWLRIAVILGLSVLGAGVLTTLPATDAVETESASATHPTVTGDYTCDTTTGKWTITWKVAGDTSYPNETATIKTQSRPTTPTFVGKTVKNTGFVTGTEVVSSAGTYNQKVEVQWTNHNAGDWVEQTGQVKITGTCSIVYTPNVALSGTSTCQVDGTYKVDWKVTITGNGTLNEVDLKVIKHLPAGSLINGVDAQVWLNEWVEHHANHGLDPFPPGGVATFTQTGIPGTATSATAGVQYDFKGGPSGDPELTITLAGDCEKPNPPKGGVTWTDTVCQALTPVPNHGTLVLEDNSTAEGFLWNGTTWVSIGNIPAGNIAETLFDDFGFPSKIRIVITGENGDSLAPLEHTFATASKDAAACEIIEPKVDASYKGVCVYDATTDESYKDGEAKLDNSGSNIPVNFVFSAPYSALSQIVPAGDVVTVSLGQIPKGGADLKITAGGQVFNLNLAPFDGCKPIDPKLAKKPATCTAGETVDYGPLAAFFNVVWSSDITKPGHHEGVLTPIAGYVLPGGVASIVVTVDLAGPNGNLCPGGELAKTGSTLVLLAVAVDLLLLAAFLFIAKSHSEWAKRMRRRLGLMGKHMDGFPVEQ